MSDMPPELDVRGWLATAGASLGAPPASLREQVLEHVTMAQAFAAVEVITPPPGLRARVESAITGVAPVAAAVTTPAPLPAAASGTWVAALAAMRRWPARTRWIVAGAIALALAAGLVLLLILTSSNDDGAGVSQGNDGSAVPAGVDATGPDTLGTATGRTSPDGSDDSDEADGSDPTSPAPSSTRPSSTSSTTSSTSTVPAENPPLVEASGPESATSTSTTVATSPGSQPTLPPTNPSRSPGTVTPSPPRTTDPALPSVRPGTPATDAPTTNAPPTETLAPGAPVGDTSPDVPAPPATPGPGSDPTAPPPVVTDPPTIPPPPVTTEAPTTVGPAPTTEITAPPTTTGTTAPPTTPPVTPTYACLGALNITQSSAVIGGVTTDQRAVTARFDLTPSDGSVGEVSVTINGTNRTFRATVTRLHARATYRVAVSFVDASGTVLATTPRGCDFVTLEAVYVCSPADGLSQLSATLGGATTDPNAVGARFVLVPPVGEAPAATAVNVDGNLRRFSTRAVGLLPGTAYTYVVVFVDANGNPLGTSVGVCAFTTLALPHVSLPTWPGELGAPNTSR